MTITRPVQFVVGPAAAPTTYPVGGYVNMNQLAHMALQHQGLCPSTDKKHEHEDLGHEQSQAGRHPADQWTDVDPHGQRSNLSSGDSAGLGMSCHR